MPETAPKIHPKTKKVRIKTKSSGLDIASLCLPSSFAAAALLLAGSAFLQPANAKKQEDCALPVILKIEPDKELAARLESRKGFCGGDAAYSIAARDLSLWLFGDSFFGTIENGKRINCRMPRNCIAIDEHLEKKGKLQYQISTNDFFPPPKPDGSYFWPGDGAYLNRRCFLVFQHLVKTDTSLPAPFQFRICANYASYLDLNQVKQSENDKPLAIELDIKAEDSLLAVACLKDKNYLYLYNADERMSKQGSHPCTVSRLPLREIARPEKIAAAVKQMEWWQSSQNKWQRNQKLASLLFTDGASEMSVVKIPGLKRFYVFYIPADKGAIMMRSAKRPEGPWSERQEVMPLNAGAGLFCYSVKAHPQYSTKKGELSLTYNVNATDAERLFADSSLYFPKAVKIAIKEVN
ncbi:MAG: DUF4185 domain-containing protein [Candidatus Obscuribacterales bacterium]|nr:DUF4185 domain-containing protein [Candidatus Obscuribacterales bacterium]